MAELDRIKRNVAKMAEQGASFDEIDGYIRAEGATPEQVRDYKAANSNSPVIPAQRPADASQADPGPSVGRGESFARGAAQGLSFNLADEIAGGGAQKQAMQQAATDRDRLAAMNEAAQRGDWDTYRQLQRGVFEAGQEAQQGATERYRVRDVLAREQNPGMYTGGEIAGVIGTGAALGGAGGLSLAGKAAGKGLGTRVAAGAAEGAAYGGAYGAGGADEGDRLQGAAAGAAAGGAAGAALPVAIAGGRSAINRGMSGYRQVFNPGREAQIRVQNAMARDAGAVAINSSDAATARLNQQPILNVDRGGETTRALARSATNTSPEARAAFQRATSDRFETQGNRVVRFLSRITGGAVDDLRLQDDLERQARAMNKTAYDRAYAVNFGDSHPVALDALQSRIPADALRNAMRVAQAEGRPFGEQLVASIDDAANTVRFRRAPSMREWDYIQRGLRSATDQAYRSGAGEVGTAYRGLRRELLDTLDSINPAYRQARQGAAAAFGAENALEAGRKFAATTRNTPEMARAVKSMSPAEKKVFQTGFASELIDRTKASRDRANIINSLFGSQESRDKMLLTFGHAKAAELESFVRIENAMDLMRGALGNSTTARQLVELGLVSGGSGGAYGLATGDWNNAAMIGAGIGAARFGAQKASAKLNENVMTKIADILLSGDEKALTRVTQNAMVSPEYMTNLRAITDAIYRAASPIAGGAAAVAGR